MNSELRIIQGQWKRTIWQINYEFLSALHSNYMAFLSMVGCVAQLVERRSLTGELSLSCAWPAADHLCGIVGKPSAVGQPTSRLSLSSFRGR